MKVNPAPPRGMRDILPREMDLRDAATATILAVYRRHGFRRVETPALESIELLTRSEGGENEKLIFKVLKRGEKLETAKVTDLADLVDLGLRFDLTVPLARYYANNHARLPQPLKAIQIGPVWRAERPQRGRYRQFTQCDIDILGVESEIAEIELILATTDALLALGLQDLLVRINDRRILAGIARHAGFDETRFPSVFIALDKLDKVETPGVIKELEAVGHPPEAVGALVDLLDPVTGAARRLDELTRVLGGDVDAAAVRALTRIIDTVGRQTQGRFRLSFDPALVRGMGYYTGPIFEVSYPGYPASIAGGGRYDRMIGKLLGREVPASGFSIGFERIISILEERTLESARESSRVALIFEEGTDELDAVLTTAARLRQDGHQVSLELRSKRLRKQLDDLAGHGFTHYAVPGAELKSLGGDRMDEES